LLIHTDQLIAFLRRCAEEHLGPYGTVHVPIFPAEGDSPRSYLARLAGQERLALDGYRSVDPAKILVYGVREKVAPVGVGSQAGLLAGVKACDIKALELLDRALINDEFADPAYSAWRERTTVLSFDCTEAGPTCHCTLVGGKPYAETGFDANAARLGSHYFLSAATEKGQVLLDLIRKHIRVDTAHDKMPPGVEARRAEMVDKVKAQNVEFERSDDYARLRQSDVEAWKRESADCVGCGACTNICPTCYCLILNEEGGNGLSVKVRSYDSCQWHGYARVAGGASPRPKMHERFRNRYLCKLVLLKSQFGSLGCTGCGRCTDACPGGIEYRAAVHRLMEGRPGGRDTAVAR
jgi:sulfhydrogenase subunit beta (sulfur reductase)